MKWIMSNVNRKDTSTEDVYPCGGQGKLPGEKEPSHGRTLTGRGGGGTLLQAAQVLEDSNFKFTYLGR